MEVLVAPGFSSARVLISFETSEAHLAKSLSSLWIIESLDPACGSVPQVKHHEVYPSGARMKAENSLPILHFACKLETVTPPRSNLETVTPLPSLNLETVTTTSPPPRSNQIRSGQPPDPTLDPQDRVRF